MSIDLLATGPAESWPFWSIAFFGVVGLLQFPANDYASHAFVQAISTGFTAPTAFMSGIGSTVPWAMPAVVVAILLGLYAWYRGTFGDAAFLVLCGCFVAVLAAG